MLVCLVGWLVVCMCAMCVVGRRRMCACVCVLSCTLKYSKFKSSVNCPLNAWVHEGWGGGGEGSWLC